MLDKPSPGLYNVVVGCNNICRRLQILERKYEKENAINWVEKEDLDYGREGLVKVSVNMIVLVVMEVGILHAPRKANFDLVGNFQPYVSNGTSLVLEMPSLNFRQT